MDVLDVGTCSSIKLTRGAELKKILIVVPSFGHGGTNRSLWNLLNSQIEKDYNISVLSMDHRGAYKEKISLYNLLPESHYLKALMPLGSSKGLDRLKRVLTKVYYKVVLGCDRQKLYKKVGKKLAEHKFDIVISFQEGTATEFASYIPAKKRIGWVRCDYSNYLRLAKKNDEIDIYNRFDNIVCVSKYTAKVFSDYYPDISDRVVAVYNIIDAKGIIETSLQKTDDERYNTDLFKIVSVGRMDAVKRFVCIPEIARKLKEQNCSFKWFIIGDGGTEAPKVKEEIVKNGVSDCVILLGAKNNPYPYIAGADILVCPSITEACPNVVNEAKILHIPVVAADFASAPEYIENGVNGIISSIDSLSDALLTMYRNKEQYDLIKREIEKFEYKNDESLQQLESLFAD